MKSNNIQGVWSFGLSKIIKILHIFFSNLANSSGAVVKWRKKGVNKFQSIKTCSFCQKTIVQK